MKRLLAALAAAPVLALSLAAAPAVASDHDYRPVPRPHPGYVWFCVDHPDVSVDLLGIIDLDIDLDLLHPWHGRYCGWVPFPYAY